MYCVPCGDRQTHDGNMGNGKVQTPTGMAKNQDNQGNFDVSNGLFSEMVPHLLPRLSP